MRPSTDRYFLQMARLVSTRGTCYRRRVGCVLVDARNRVIATGYNGVPSGANHCNFVTPSGLNPFLCPGALSASGTNLNACRAIHAEANALISCRHPEDIHTAYVTTSPCTQCTEFLMNTECRRIVFEEEYPHLEAGKTWTKQARQWIHLPLESNVVESNKPSSP